MQTTTVVLAGGRSSRFGQDKTRALLGDTTLLDRVLDALPDDADVIVVGEQRPTTRTVRWVRETPVFAGPLAGLGAALPLIGADAFTLIGGDMPLGAPALAQLADLLRTTPVDAVVATDLNGHRQPLLAAYRTAAVRAAMPADPADRSMRALLHDLDVTTVPVEEQFVTDIDTPEDLARMSSTYDGTPARAAREADLVTYYDNEAADRQDNPLPEARVAHRDEFVAQLKAEGRSRLLEVGTGPGRDALAFQQAGLTVSGVDLAPASVELCQQAGLDVRVGSALGLPFGDGEFDAAYTASTLLHVADEDLDTALAELVRVVRPGAPIAIGLWGAQKSRQERWGRQSYGPPRFFALRSDADLTTTLVAHGVIERFETWPSSDGDELHYQWVVLRTPDRA
ncbi:NTP transferase domain-containing protein [Flexivirga sp. ID2601S]|uniref:NTP transferase domain-containing protein n=1 Tax=Flexivirga aerilata TaxID=1656889 RepID=A0A849AMV4_9MICO|nr:NTP transferase domain-containing protein [Flexivirga aerilata]NNG38142.1 NTP transferase domain-containing protein [Flexivirga aerilata]